MIRYCAQAGCGKPNTYTAVKPKFCSACGKPFDVAFATATPPPVAPAPVYEEPVYPNRPAPVQRVYRDARGRDISHLYQRQEPQTPVHHAGDEDYYDQNAAKREARQLAASIAGAFQFASDGGTVMKFQDLPVAQEIRQASKEGPKKRTRKKA